jgi:hypothetical protein
LNNAFKGIFGTVGTFCAFRPAGATIRDRDFLGRVPGGGAARKSKAARTRASNSAVAGGRPCGDHRQFSGRIGLRHANATAEPPATDDRICARW